MEAVRRKLAELTGRDVDYVELASIHKFRFRDAEKPTHWLHVGRALVDDEGEEVVIQRLSEFQRHLIKEESQKVTLAANGVFAEPVEA